MDEMIAQQLADFMKAATTLATDLLEMEKRTENEEKFVKELAAISILLMMAKASGGGPAQ